MQSIKKSKNNVKKSEKIDEKTHSNLHKIATKNREKFRCKKSSKILILLYKNLFYYDRIQKNNGGVFCIKEYY